MNCSTCGRPASDGYVNVVAGERCVDEVHDAHLDPELALYAAHVRERIAEASAPVRTLENRVRNWTGTVHYATDGRPACGSADRTASTWLAPTLERVTCSRCIAGFGEDSDAPATDEAGEHYADEHARRRAEERAARRIERELERDAASGLELGELA